MWEVITVATFDKWFLSLNNSEQISVLTGVFKIKEFGPMLGRPDVDTLVGNLKIKNLKELRVQHKGRPYRVFFAFDTIRRAVLLCGGDKSNNKRFYEKMLQIAQHEYLKHLEYME